MMRPFVALSLLLCALPSKLLWAQKPSEPTVVTVAATGKAISPDLFGIFFEDLSYAADGGLYAELIQNRSFEYSAADKPNWNAATGWTFHAPAASAAAFTVDSAQPLNGRNPTYAVVTTQQTGPEVQLENQGFGGIVIHTGQSYHLSLFIRQVNGTAAPWTVRLLDPEDHELASAALPAPGPRWTRITAELQPTRSSEQARLSLSTHTAGATALDMVSLFPAHTFHNRPNGMRADLAQSIAELKPKFIRFPGGCLVHGDGLANMYRWKASVGPVEERLEQPNIWGYHQTLGLGFFEYFQFAEDIGATPVPIVSAGVSCQNSGASVTGKWGLAQQALPLVDMPSYTEDVLDLIEFANGPVTSTWGARRAAAGHPAPFHLRYIGIGNEDAQTDAFRQRFRLLYDAVKARYPEVMVIGTIGPDPQGKDYEAGMQFASQVHVPVVDEHSYETPAWFEEHQDHFDSYDRNGPRIYLGEYAAFDAKRGSTLRAALSEAAYMTGLERNGDLVLMSSYAPLLSRDGESRWNPDLIHFNNSTVEPTLSYEVQKLFSNNAGDTYLPATSNRPLQAEQLAVSSVRDSHGGDLILKVVNYGDAARSLRLILPLSSGDVSAAITVLQGSPDAINEAAAGRVLEPQRTVTRAQAATPYTAPPHSLSVLRFAAIPAAVHAAALPQHR